VVARLPLSEPGLRVNLISLPAPIAAAESKAEIFSTQAGHGMLVCLLECHSVFVPPRERASQARSQSARIAVTGDHEQ
jgi:hypothetical protein